MIEQADKGRACGSCSLCCKVMVISEDEGVPGRASINKPDGMWCRFCKPGSEKPCTIYADRPRLCSGFTCGWLTYQELPSYWKPDSCKMIIDISGRENDPIKIWCDIDAEDRWRTEPFIGDLFWLAQEYLVQKRRVMTVLPPRFRVGKPYHAICPISRSVLDLEGQDRPVSIAGLPYHSIHEDLLVQLNEELSWISEPAAALPRLHTSRQYEEAQAEILRRLRSRGYMISASRRRITR